MKRIHLLKPHLFTFQRKIRFHLKFYTTRHLDVLLCIKNFRNVNEFNFVKNKKQVSQTKQVRYGNGRFS